MKIGLLGLAGAGKDTVAEVLQQQIPGSRIERYAGPLKRAAMQVFGSTFDLREVKEVPVTVTERMMDDMIEAAIACAAEVGFSEEEENEASWRFFDKFYPGMKCSPRLFQQLLGTEVVRAVRPSAFVERIKRMQGTVIVPDVRFENETLDVNVLVVRPGTRMQERPEHPSEHLAWHLTEQALGMRFPAELIGKRTTHVLYNMRPLDLFQTHVQQYWAVLKQKLHV